MKIIGFIPCKLTSARLHRKNLQVINGRPLVEWAVRYLKTSKAIETIYVSTNLGCTDPLESQLREYKGIQFIEQDLHSDPQTWLRDLYIDAIQRGLLGAFDWLVSATPDNPQRPHQDLDQLIYYAVSHNLHEVMTVDSETGDKRGALNIVSREAIIRQSIAGYAHVIQAPIIDIHTQADLERARQCLTNLS